MVVGPSHLGEPRLRLWLGFERYVRYEYDAYDGDYEGAETVVHGVASIALGGVCGRLEWVSDVHGCRCVYSGTELVVKIVHQIQSNDMGPWRSSQWYTIGICPYRDVGIVDEYMYVALVARSGASCECIDIVNCSWLLKREVTDREGD